MGLRGLIGSVETLKQALAVLWEALAGGTGALLGSWSHQQVCPLLPLLVLWPSQSSRTRVRSVLALFRSIARTWQVTWDNQLQQQIDSRLDSLSKSNLCTRRCNNNTTTTTNNNNDNDDHDNDNDDHNDHKNNNKQQQLLQLQRRRRPQQQQQTTPTTTTTTTTTTTRVPTEPRGLQTANKRRNMHTVFG